MSNVFRQNGGFSGNKTMSDHSKVSFKRRVPGNWTFDRDVLGIDSWRSLLLMVVRKSGRSVTTVWMVLKPWLNNGINKLPAATGEFTGFLVAINSISCISSWIFRKNFREVWLLPMTHMTIEGCEHPYLPKDFPPQKRHRVMVTLMYINGRHSPPNSRFVDLGRFGRTVDIVVLRKSWFSGKSCNNSNGNTWSWKSRKVEHT